MHNRSSFILLTCDRNKKQEIKSRLSSLEEIKEITPTKGIYDLIVKAELKSQAQSKDLMEQIKEIKNIRSTLTLAVIDPNEIREITI